MGEVLLQHGKPISFHFEIFNGVVTNYPTYDKELYELVQIIKKWKNYLMGKETIIPTNHQPLQYLQSCNSHAISDGWVLYNNSIWLLGIRKESKIRYLICFQGLL